MNTPQKITLNDEGTVTDTVYRKRTASQPHCMLWVLYTLNSILENSQPKSIKLKMSGYKLRRGVSWSGVLKQKCVDKQV